MGFNGRSYISGVGVLTDLLLLGDSLLVPVAYERISGGHDKKAYPSGIVCCSRRTLKKLA